MKGNVKEAKLAFCLLHHVLHTRTYHRRPLQPSGPLLPFLFHICKSVIVKFGYDYGVRIYCELPVQNWCDRKVKCFNNMFHCTITLCALVVVLGVKTPWSHPAPGFRRIYNYVQTIFNCHRTSSKCGKLSTTVFQVYTYLKSNCLANFIERLQISSASSRYQSTGSSVVVVPDGRTAFLVVWGVECTANRLPFLAQRCSWFMDLRSMETTFPSLEV